MASSLAPHLNLHSALSIIPSEPHKPYLCGLVLMPLTDLASVVCPSLPVAHRAFLLCWKKGGPLHTANTQSKLPSLFVNFRIRHILKRKLWFWEIFIKSFASIGYFSLYLVGLALPFIRLLIRPLLFEPISNFFLPNLISSWIEIWTA